MNKEKSFEEKVESEEWGAWKFVSEMLDVPHPDEELAKCGIYNTSKCYEQIHDFVVEQKQKSLTSYTAELKKKLEELKEYWEPTCSYDSEEEKGYQKGIQAQVKLKNKQIDNLLSELNHQ